MRETNRQWIYSRPVNGTLHYDNFRLEEKPIPELRQGQVLVRNKLISLDPANRTYFVQQTYRPQLKIGDVMAGFGIGEVVAAKDLRFKVGDIVHGDLGWQDYSIINSYERSEYVYKCTAGYSEEELLGVLGITGLTAYFGIREVGKLQPGETVVVGGATGACGVIIGQLAKIAGCHVIGFGGGSEKCQWLIDEMGFDGAVDYKKSSVAEDLAEKCPNGVDFFSDAIGGIVTKSTLPLMKTNARWFHYGNLSSYDTSNPGETVRLDEALTPELRTLCKQRNLKPIFLLVFDYYCQRKKAEDKLAGLIKEGRLKAPTTTIKGLEKLPTALIEGTIRSVIQGKNRFGKLNVRVD